MRPAAALAVLVSLLGGGALAQGAAQAPASGRAMHDIPWYAAHPAEREAILRFCRTSHAYARNLDCLNAETGGTQAWRDKAARQAGLRGGAGGPFGDLVSPAYWAANRLGRQGVLWGCARPVPSYEADVCAAARKGEALAAGRGGAR